MKIKIHKHVIDKLHGWITANEMYAKEADIEDQARGYSAVVIDNQGAELCLASDEYEVISE